MKQKGISKFRKSWNIHHKMGKVAPLVYIRKSTYLFPSIAIAQHALLQVISLCITIVIKNRNFYHESPTGAKCVGILQFAGEGSELQVSMHCYQKSEFGFQPLMLTEA